MKTKAPAQASVQKVSVSLPTTFDYSAELFYVRECYKTYYDRAIQLLQKYNYISVTGTPGIGKSLFYDYFFSRYKSEHPKVSIVTAAFNENRLLENCVVFKSDGSSVSWDIYDFPDIKCDYPNAIHLYDGPPSVKPVGSKMVAFTSPNFDWLDSMRKNLQAHCTLFMPVWELGELWDAVQLLHLDLSFEELIKRYQLFGGVPRYCLITNPDHYQQGVLELEETIQKIKTFEDVQACFEMSIQNNLLVHHLLHYVPNENPRFATLRFGSDLIGAQIYDRLVVKLDRKREKLINWLEDAGKAFYGWMFENLAHELLIQGGIFTCIQLDEQGQKETLSVVSTIGHYKRFESNFTLEMVFQNVYELPKFQSFKSIDSYIFSNHKLFLFQITTLLNHPVNCAGLVELFAKLELGKKIKQNPRLAQLIFVVPKGMGELFKRQKLTSGQVLKENWMDADVKIIPGISLVMEENLKTKGIYKCSELDARGEEETLRREFKCLKKFKAQLKDLSYLDQIPQYVLEMEV